MIYLDREEAGRELAQAVSRAAPAPPVLVLALPRGGLPLGLEVARALDSPLDVLVVRKIGMPGQRELAIGAIATGDVVLRNPGVPARWLDEAGFAELVAQERRELLRREQAYRGSLAPLDLQGRAVVLVDDGIATGATMLVAVQAARRGGAREVIVAAPVASTEAARALRAAADAVVFLDVPPDLQAVGQYYARFDQLQDADVLDILRRSRQHAGKARRNDD